MVVGGEHDRVGCGGIVRSRAVREQGQHRVAPQIRATARDDDPLGPALLGTARVLGVPDVHENRDPVALGDRLAQPSLRHVRDVRAPVVDGVGSRRRERREAGLPPGRRVDRQVDPRPGARRTATTRCGTRSTAGRTRRSAVRPPPRGRAGSSRTSRASTAGTRTSSRRWRDACCSRTPTRSRPPCSTRCTSGRRRPDSRSWSSGTYDLFVVCGLDVPWRHDGIREFEEQRRSMHERYVERARASGSPWLLVEGPHDRRVEAASAAVDRVLG